jgi:hypothetical protein
MQFTGYSFGSVRVDGVTYDHDLIIDHGTIRKRKKAASRAAGQRGLLASDEARMVSGASFAVTAGDSANITA